MWLRVGKRQRWTGRALEEAISDIEPREGEDLSVFRVGDEDEADEVAAAFALANRAGPTDIDFALIPEASTERCGFVVKKTSVSGQPAFLDQRHHEVVGLQDRTEQERLTKAILQDEPKAKRLRKSEIAEIYRRISGRDGVEESVQPRWRSFLEERSRWSGT